MPIEEETNDPMGLHDKEFPDEVDSDDYTDEQEISRRKPIWFVVGVLICLAIIVIQWLR